MARAKRDGSLDYRSNRLKLPSRKEPYWSSLAPGQSVGYYRPTSGRAGSWVAKWRDAETGNRRKETLGTADDYQDADGKDTLSWPQAQEQAHHWFKNCTKHAWMAAEGEEVTLDHYTVKDAIDDYLAEQKRLGKKGLPQAEHAARAHILPVLGDIEVAKLTRSRLEKWLGALAEAPRRKRAKHLQEGPVFLEAPKTDDDKRRRRDSANRIWTTLKAALNLALKRGKATDGSAWHSVQDFKGTTSARVRCLSIPDQVRLVNACPPDLRRLVTAALHTGARFGELIQLEVKDFDQKSGTIYIGPHVSKTGKPRHIVLTSEGREFFAAITAGRESGERILQRDGVTRRRHSEIGNAWGKSDQNRPLDAACKSSGIERCTFHELRHTAASTWINAGMSLGDVAEQLGDSEQTTKKHYIHLCPNALAARIRKIAPVLGINEPSTIEPLKISGS